MRSLHPSLGLLAAATIVLSCAAGCGGDAEVQVDEDSGADAAGDGTADTGKVDTGAGDATGDSGTGDTAPVDAPADTAATDGTPTDSAATDGATDGATDAVATDAVTDAVTTDSGDAGTAAKLKAATDLATAICSREKTCNSFAFAVAWVDDSTCIARHKLELLDRLDAPGSGDTTTSFGLCAAAYPTHSCDKIASHDVPGDCRPTGSVAKAGACAWHSQCATGFCARASDDTCAACADKPKAGDSCALVDDCGRDLLCVLDKCVKLGAKGDTCDVGGALGAVNPCLPGLGCIVVGTATTGKCDTPIASGAECDYDEQCDQGNGYYCKDGATSSDPSTCALTPLHSAGESCIDTTTVPPAECKGGTSCYGAGVASGKCITNAAEGASCNLTETSSGPACTFPAVCDSATSKCVLPTAATCL